MKEEERSFGAGDWRKKNGKENWEIIRFQVLKPLARAGKATGGGSKGDVRREAATRGMVKKSRGVGVVQGSGSEKMK